MLPVVIEDIIYKYKTDLCYGDVLEELEREINMFKKYHKQRVTLNGKFSYYSMKKKRWKNKKLKYKKLEDVRCCNCFDTMIPSNMFKEPTVYKYDYGYDKISSLHILCKYKNKGCENCRKFSRYYYYLFNSDFYN